MAEELSWDDHELLARIAHRSYVDGRTQEEIAHEFGLSRPKVQRLLERARTELSYPGERRIIERALSQDHGDR